MIAERVTIRVNEKESVSAVLSAPARFKSGMAVITAHGAGNDMENPLLVAFSRRLAEAGFLAVRFNFPYKEHGRKAPDRQELLELAWLRVYDFVKGESGRPVRRIFLASKSMGGRIASQMLAGGGLDGAGMIFLGYPLHPAGEKDKLRDGHLPRIRVPMLFFAGTRDPLCDLDLLKKAIGRIGPKADLEVIEGGDHSFNLPKAAALTAEQVYEKIAARSIEWIAAH